MDMRAPDSDRMSKTMVMQQSGSSSSQSGLRDTMHVFPPLPPVLANSQHLNSSSFTSSSVHSGVSHTPASSSVDRAASPSSPCLRDQITTTTAVRSAQESHGGLPDVTRVAASRDAYSDQSPGQSNFGPLLLSNPRISKGAKSASSPAIELRSGQDASRGAPTSTHRPNSGCGSNMGNSTDAVKIDGGVTKYGSAMDVDFSVSKPNASTVDNSSVDMHGQFSMLEFIGSSYQYGGFRYSADTIRKLLHGARILYLCSGLERPGDFSHCSSQLGIVVTCIDTELDAESHDLVEQSNFERIHKQVIDDEFDAVLSSPPCSTFSMARSNWH